ncbi:MAG: transporter substrate-binding domain-containing protein [Bacteroidales bacterium]|nr:transporter substrate-binding domain-containing protein [Bacteroidales bacterium]
MGLLGQIIRLIRVPIIFSFLFLYSCGFEQAKDHDFPEQLVAKNPGKILEKIRERGKLVAITDYNSTNYFIYRGQPMGYHYELLRSFADDLGVKLVIIPENDIEKAFDMLENEEADLIAMDLAVNAQRQTQVDFTEPHAQTAQVLVQRKPNNWRKMATWEEVETQLLRDPLDLGGKKVYVQKNSSHKLRLENMMEEMGDSIFIVEDPELEVEDLIARVADGFIDFAISDERVAMVNKKYYPDLDIETHISFSQKLAWAVKKGQDSLRLTINSWSEGFMKSKTEKLVYNKYFKNEKTKYIVRSEFHTVNGGKISVYDDVIRKYCQELNWDWRLVASIIYQESNFRPESLSWAGAFGLMQLMPGTAESYGVDSLSTPEEQIEAGVKYLGWIDKQMKKKVDNERERIKFVLAAYNVGIAHVFDAMRLADKYGKDPQVWDDNVDYYLLNKSNPKYYKDSVVYYGYARGEEPYNYVYEIMDRYQHYLAMISMD